MSDKFPKCGAERETIEFPNGTKLKCQNVFLCGTGNNIQSYPCRIRELESIISAFMAATSWVGDTPRGEVIEAYQRIRDVRAMVVKKGKVS